MERAMGILWGRSGGALGLPRGHMRPQVAEKGAPGAPVASYGPREADKCTLGRPRGPPSVTLPGQASYARVHTTTADLHTERCFIDCFRACQVRTRAVKSGGGSEGYVQIRKTQDEPQWIVAQGLLSALTIPGFS